MWNLLPFLKLLDVEVGIQSNTISKRYLDNLFCLKSFDYIDNITELFRALQYPKTAQKNGLTHFSFHYPILLNIFFYILFLGFALFSQLETWYFVKKLFAFHPMSTYLKKVSCPSFTIFQRWNDINIIILFLMPIIVCTRQIMRNIEYLWFSYRIYHNHYKNEIK